MLYKIYPGLLFLLLFSNCSQNKKTNSNKAENTVVFATQLPKKINETSGLEYFDGQLITHNDSGDDPLLYGFSKTGALLETYVVEDAENHDWEDIAMDDRYLYISDSGNNFGNRKNLKIIITGLLNKLTDINLIFDEIDYICKNPKSGIDFSFLREGYYRSKMKSHFIFYKINKIDNKIEIIRILYQRMDIDNRLK